MPQLRVKNGPAQGKMYDLAQEVTQLGREAEVQILDTAASRRHAEVFAIGDMYFLRDLKSRNGTFLNEEPLGEDDQALLRVGDLIRIGATHVVFEEPAPNADKMPEFTSGEEDFGATMELRLDADQIAEAAPDVGEASLHFAVLYDVAKAISRAFDARSLMQQVCDITSKATRADGVYVFVREAGKLVPVAHKRRGDRHELKISSTIIKRSLQHNRAVLVSDALSDSRFSASSSVVMRGIRSVICAPLLAREHVGGVLYLHSSSIEGAFTDEHLRLVTAIALEAAVALDATRAHEQSRKQLTSVFRTLITAHEQGSPTAVEGHSDRVNACASAICQALELPAAEAHTVELAALLHEIGKIGAPEGSHGRSESRHAYAILGAEMLRKIDGMEAVAAGVEAHLERLDGTGGPRGLVGHQIPRAARVVGLADEFVRRLAEAGATGKRSEAVKQVLMTLNTSVPGQYDAEAFNGLVVALRTGTLQPL